METLHCWKGKREEVEEKFGMASKEWAETWAPENGDGTCMLERDHEGPHEFTPDSQIGIRFAPLDAEAAQKKAL